MLKLKFVEKCFFKSFGFLQVCNNFLSHERVKKNRKKFVTCASKFKVSSTKSKLLIKIMITTWQKEEKKMYFSFLKVFPLLKSKLDSFPLSFSHFFSLT